MGLTIPKSIKTEHKLLHKDLSRLIQNGGKVGTAAREVAGTLHKHFLAEEKYAMPPLGVLIKFSKRQKS